MIHRVEATIAGRTLTLETGKLAGQADGAVVARYGDTIVLATVVAAKEPRPGTDFFPLTVDYEEKLYAAGKIPGSRYVKREGRPTDEAILVCRLIDRPLRPLFQKGMRHDVQVVITTLSADQDNAPDILGMVAASAAVSISDIPFDGPIGGVRLGLLDGELVINPSDAQLKSSQLDLAVAGTKDAVLMVEAGADGVSEQRMLEAIKLAHTEIQKLCALQETFRTLAGKPKKVFPLHHGSDQVAEQVRAAVTPMLPQRFAFDDKDAYDQAIGALRAKVGAALPDAPAGDVSEAFDGIIKQAVRAQVLDQHVRSDGRSLEQIRNITCEVGLLPRTHGSAVFTRGQTQALTIVTLGSGSDEQILRTLGPEATKRYIHQYNMAGFTTGEVKRVGVPGRREIGHGALAERALLSVIPPKEKFPYTIRVVTEIMSSNGSTSMASVCGSTLSLMDAGVPLKAPVAGVAMGLVSSDDNSRYAVLTDILGMEDALGDMDFKVAGTAEGITALQMDLKAQGLPFPIMEDALAQAKTARLFILGKMLEALPASRSDLSLYAPRIFTIKINPEKIGTIIGPGGKMVRRIQEETGSTVEIEDDGTINVATSNGEQAAKAIAMIRGLVEEVEVGKEYDGTVKRIMDIGAFVEVLPGKEGLVRINNLANHFVEHIEDVVKLGDKLRVKVLSVDNLGRINLSHKVTLADYVEPAEGEERTPQPQSGGEGGPRPRFGSRPFENRRPPQDRPRFDRGPAEHQPSEHAERGGEVRNQPPGGYNVQPRSGQDRPAGGYRYDPRRPSEDE